MKKNSKTRTRPTGELCPMCGKGTTHMQKLDYKLKDENGKEFVVPEIDVEICNFCGEHIFNMQAVRKAERLKGQRGKILLYLQPTTQAALSARAKRNNRSLRQEAHHLLESVLQAAN